MEDLEFIKKYSKISVSEACKKANVDRSNLYAGRVKNKNKLKDVRENIESEIAKLYIKEEKRGK